MEKHSRSAKRLSVFIILVITSLSLHTAVIPNDLFVDTFDGLACAFTFTLDVPSARRSLSLTSSFIHMHSVIHLTEFLLSSQLLIL